MSTLGNTVPVPLQLGSGSFLEVRSFCYTILLKTPSYKLLHFKNFGLILAAALSTSRRAPQCCCSLSMSLLLSLHPADAAWRTRPLTTSLADALAPPPAHILRVRNPLSLFFDFRAHPALTPDDILRIFADPALAHAEDILGITFVA